MRDDNQSPVDRRSLLKLIGTAAGSTVMYQAMSELGYAGESDFTGPVKLGGHAKGTSVLILGAGWAGMVAAYELGKAGYKVHVLEYNDRAGGRNWSLYGGDTYTELGGATQHVQFDKGLYINPGPWRLPHHHRAILYYCKLLNIPLEPFVQANYAAYVQSDRAFGGQPKRYREVHADFNGYVAETLAKATHQSNSISPSRRRIKNACSRRCGPGARSTRTTNTKRTCISSERRG